MVTRLHWEGDYDWLLHECKYLLGSKHYFSASTPMIVMFGAIMLLTTSPHIYWINRELSFYTNVCQDKVMMSLWHRRALFDTVTQEQKGRLWLCFILLVTTAALVLLISSFWWLTFHHVTWFSLSPYTYSESGQTWVYSATARGSNSTSNVLRSTHFKVDVTFFLCWLSCSEPTVTTGVAKLRLDIFSFSVIRCID